MDILKVRNECLNRMEFSSGRQTLDRSSTQKRKNESQTAELFVRTKVIKKLLGSNDRFAIYKFDPRFGTLVETVSIYLLQKGQL